MNAKMHWNGFILSEHREATNEAAKEATKVKKPELDEQETEIINGKILMAEVSHLQIEITYYSDGTILKAKGKIKEVDRYWNLLQLRNKEITEVRTENLLDFTILKLPKMGAIFIVLISK